jgi:hypothetical protein
LLFPALLRFEARFSFTFRPEQHHISLDDSVRARATIAKATTKEALAFPDRSNPTGTRKDD